MKSKLSILLAAPATAVILAGCTCIARGSRVLTPAGWRPIEELEIGDGVYSVDETTGERHETRVTNIRSAKREVGSVSFAGTTLRMTSDHPVYCPVRNEYKPAGDWFLGERNVLAMLTDGGLDDVVVTAAEAFVGIDDVFDITVEHELHNFIAEGVLVHNKSEAITECTIENGVVAEEGFECECEDGGTGEAFCYTNGGQGYCRGCGVDNGSTTDTGVMPTMDTGSTPTDMGSTTMDVGGADIGTDAGADSGMAMDAGADM